MFENIINFFKKISKKEKNKSNNSKDTAKERLHLVLMQDRANVSADFLELMKQEIIDVIKKYIDIDEGAIDVRLTNKENEDGTNGAPALYANIPILNMKNDIRKTEEKEKQKEEKVEEVEEVKKELEKEEEVETKETIEISETTLEETKETEEPEKEEIIIQEEKEEDKVQEEKEDIATETKIEHENVV